MNAHTHCLIFNTRRNCLMAVADSARSCGKGRQAAGRRCRRRQATTTATEVVSSKPGRILAGGNASFNGNLENSDSKIIAGGTLAHTGGSLTNTATPGIRTTTYSGWAQFRDWDGDDEALDFGPAVGFNPKN